MLLQTYIMDNDIHNNLGASFTSFATRELTDRENLLFPPFSQIIKLSFAHPNVERAEQEAMQLKSKLETQYANFRFSSLDRDILSDSETFRILGPAPAFIPRVKNRYIWQIMIKSQIASLPARNHLLRIVPSTWKIDIDPVDIGM